MDDSKKARLDVSPDAIAAIRQCKTSDLILMLAHPEGAADSVAAIAMKADLKFVDPAPFWKAIAAEIDRRIPVPDSRIGKLVRRPGRSRALRVVGVEPGGALRLRADAWHRHAVDLRVDPDLIAPGDWLDG